jgi:tetratricopeptide (TPR) repeat protein
MAMIERIPRKEQMLVRALNAGLEEGFDAQMPYLREMQKLYPEDKEMLFGIGDVSFHTDHYDTAQVYFERVLELDPYFERALQHLTWTYLRTDQFQKGYDVAVRWAERAGSAEAFQYLGNAAYALGKPEETITWYEKAREVSDHKEWSTVALARAHTHLGQTDAAVAELRGVIDSDARMKYKFSAFGSLAMNVLPYLGRYEEALETLEAGIDSAAAHGDSSMVVMGHVWKLSLLYWGWHDDEAAMEQTRRIIDASPDSIAKPEVRVHRGVHMILKGRIDEGLELIEKFNKQPVAMPLYKSLAAAQRGDCDGAVALLDSTVGIPEANLIGIRFRAAMCYYDAGDYETAARHFAIITGEDMFDFNNALMIPLSHYYEGKSLDALGKTKAALESYRAFLDLWSGADEDRPRLLEARARVAALESAGSM